MEDMVFRVLARVSVQQILGVPPNVQQRLDASTIQE